MTVIIDHEPDPESAKMARERYLDGLAETILHELNNEMSAFRLVRDANGYTDRVVLTDGARVLIRRLLKENL